MAPPFTDAQLARIKEFFGSDACFEGVTDEETKFDIAARELSAFVVSFMADEKAVEVDESLQVFISLKGYFTAAVKHANQNIEELQEAASSPADAQRKVSFTTLDNAKNELARVLEREKVCQKIVDNGRRKQSEFMELARANTDAVRKSATRSKTSETPELKATFGAHADIDKEEKDLKHELFRSLNAEERKEFNRILNKSGKDKKKTLEAKGGKAKGTSSNKKTMKTKGDKAEEATSDKKENVKSHYSEGMEATSEKE